MSVQEFKIAVLNKVDDALVFLRNLQSDCEKLPSAETLGKINTTLKINLNYLPRIDLSLHHDELLEAVIEVGSSVPLEFFEALVKRLESIPDIQFKARLFDSSSGGVATWGCDDDIDLDGKNILLVGEMAEDLEDMHDLVESVGQLHHILMHDTDIVVAGENADEDLLAEAKSQGVAVITEDEFWDFIANQPG